MLNCSMGMRTVRAAVTQDAAGIENDANDTRVWKRATHRFRQSFRSRLSLTFFKGARASGVSLYSETRKFSAPSPLGDAEKGRETG